MIQRLALIALLFTSACSGVIPNIGAAPTTVAPTQAPTTVASTATSLPPSPTTPPTDTPSPTLTPTPVAFGPTNFPANVSPLSGDVASDPANLERRPVAVKVQIFPRGQRPPSGISKADIVYDFYQNFGLTRLHAIFLGENAEVVGPIRSARLLDIDLINMYKSIFAFGGAESRTINRLFNQAFSNRLIVEGSGKCPAMCRVDPNGYNYLVANTAEITNYAEAQGIDNTRQNLDGMSYHAAIPAGGGPAPQIYVRVSISSYSRWDYDPVGGRYLRFQDSIETHDVQGEAYEPLTDRENGLQVTAENVVVLMVPHQYAFGSKPGPNEVVNILLSGSGEAYAFRDGQGFEVTWNRPAIDSVLLLTFPDGTPYTFKPGNTWFQIVGQSSKVENPESIWRFTMNIP